MKTKAAALMFALAAPMLASACAPYEADPVSVYQWERKVQEIERRALMNCRLKPCSRYRSRTFGADELEITTRAPR